MEYHLATATINSEKAFLVVGKDEVDILRVVGFIGNQSWRLNECFDKFKSIWEYSKYTNKVMNIHGDPGKFEPIARNR